MARQTAADPMDSGYILGVRRRMGYPRKVDVSSGDGSVSCSTWIDHQYLEGPERFPEKPPEKRSLPLDILGESE